MRLLLVLSVCLLSLLGVSAQAGQRLGDRMDRMICQTGCAFLSNSHREGCCRKYHYNRCC